MSTESILRKYRSKYVERGSECLFRPSDAQDFLEDIIAENIDILGIDLWRPIVTNGTEHLMEDSSVFLTQVDNPHEVARIFLRRHLPPEITLVSFVLDD